MARRLQREEYTVGWVCALPVELAAAQEMLDEEHADFERDEHDSNVYSLGCIGEHNVVIVCLPAGLIGNNPAAQVGTQLRATFRAVRFGLMVGIGGGVPTAETDIRLGDVAVSQPHLGHGGVIQYDFGKSTTSGFQHTGFLNSPPIFLLGAVNKLRANQLRGRTKLQEHVSKLGRLPQFTRKAAGPDVLFEAAYNHEKGPTCESCNAGEQVVRQPRPSEEPVIHYGTIASGNKVIKNAAERDTVSKEFGGVLCFEMEAAGLMNSFPCLVIRGICDYADSHKNKTWQPYAAGVAAACAKELLSTIPPAAVAKASTVDDTIKAASSVSNTWNNSDSKIGEQVGTKTVHGNQSITF
jgi:nucleoside phosphorylase